MINLMLHNDNVLYQHELGLIDEQTAQRSHKKILETAPVWELIGMQPTFRIRRVLFDDGSGEPRTKLDLVIE